MATFHVGTRYQYTLLGLAGTVTAVFGDHHQVNMRLDDGREVQGVWFHHLQDLPKAPKPAAAIHDSVGPTSDPPKPAPPVVEPARLAKRPSPRYLPAEDAPEAEA